jgi:hypothetical protein
MNAKELANQIKNGSFDSAELNLLVDALKYARASLTQQRSRELSIGVEVKFRDSRGAIYQGTVDSIKIKNAIVVTNRGRYRVPMNLLEII